MELNVTAADLQRIQSSDLAICVPTEFGINLHLHFRMMHSRMMRCDPPEKGAVKTRAPKCTFVQLSRMQIPECKSLMRNGLVGNAPGGHFHRNTVQSTDSMTGLSLSALIVCRTFVA